MFVCRFCFESSYQHFINVYHCYVYMASSYQHIEGLYHGNILLLSTYWTCVTALIQLHKLVHSPTYLPLTLSPDISYGWCRVQTINFLQWDMDQFDRFYSLWNFTHNLSHTKFINVLFPTAECINLTSLSEWLKCKSYMDILKPAIHSNP